MNKKDGVNDRCKNNEHDVVVELDAAAVLKLGKRELTNK
jgi:hypothetical protein